jgi:dipeptidyl-peptidase-4
MTSLFRAVAFFVVAMLGSTLAAQVQPTLSVDAIYHPDRRVDFTGAPMPEPSWLDPATYVVAQRQARGTEWLKVDAASGRSSPLFAIEGLERALRGVQGAPADDVTRILRSGALSFNSTWTGALLTLDGDLYYYDVAAARVTRLTRTAGEEEEATLSPDGRLAAFVRGNNLHVVAVASARERALTSDGGTELLNGKLDWLYQEEIYGRGRFRGYWWSPDSTRVAFLQLDERPVPSYTVVDHIPYRPALEVTDYPKAGDPNPKVRLGIARVDGGRPTWADLQEYGNSEILVVNVDWTPDARQVVHQVQNREQTWLDLRLADAEDGKGRRVLRETTPAWVNENGNPLWLADGSFLWPSERNGFKHLYHYKPDGSLVRQVTSGPWEVRTVYGADRSNQVYFSAPERDALSTDIYRIGLDGAGLARLSRTPGTHRAIFNPDFTRYVDVWSDATTPAQARLHDDDGSELRVLSAGSSAALSALRLSKPEFVQIKARDGFPLDALLIKPPDFDPARRYPVYQFTYAGPGAAQVRNRWGSSEYLFHQLLAQHGVVVWVLDNRSASGRGAQSQWPVYGRLGELELQDLEDGVSWLKQQTFVDASRMILSGWSYGGFMTAYALTHSTSWAAGIVGAPVTDWRDYDSIYTERLMKLPANNEDGYRRTAPRFAASQLHGRMLLVHGTMDDNVHMQNSVQFAYELQRAGKSFDLMVYPRSRHSFNDPRLTTHLRKLMFDFVMKTVGTAGGTAP